MINPQKTWFISDLHLEETHPHAISQFLTLLMTAETSVDALYILGDLFETWIGDDDDTRIHRQIIEALRAATLKGLKIYFICGNRDFLIGKKFAKATGCQLLNDEEKIILYGTPVLLMHGDTLCTKDLAYLKARKKAHNIFLQTLFLLLPLKLRKKIANNMRAKSMAHTKITPFEIMDVTTEEVVSIMRKHEVNILIHGHTHRPAIHHFSLDGKAATRIVLGAWHERGNMLVWEATGRREWVEIID